MRGLSRWAGGLALAAMMASAATPAMADRGPHGGWNRGGWDRGGWDRGGWNRGRHYDRGGDGFGTFLGVAAVLGAVAVIASSAAKDKRAAEGRIADRPVDAPPPPPVTTETASEDAAVDDCALAAREEGSRDGAYAEVREITMTRLVEKGWDVDGTVDQRQGYRGTGVTRRFSCTWREGQVADLVLSRDTLALR
ncbi:MAG: hypothetical protein ABW184_07395 [Sphingobium sp.]